MAPTPSVKIEKTFLYRQATRTFTNRYHFTGGTPADDTHWHTLFDNIVAGEKAIYSTRVTIVAAVGYGAGSDLPVSSKTYSQAGTWTPGGSDVQCPGDCVALERWSTAARTSKNHPVYLYSYWHGVYRDSSDPDTLASGQQAAMQTYAQNWWNTGFSDGAVTYVRAGPNGANAISRFTHGQIYHRDFPN
jgi:hypothetical protein